VKPLTLSASASVTTAIVGEPVFLRAVGGDDSGENRYRWEQIDNGSVLSLENADTAMAAFTSRIVNAPSSATFRVTLINKFGAGAQSDVTVALAAGILPAITSIVPSHVAAGEEVKISGSGFTNALTVAMSGSGTRSDIEFGVISDHEIRFVAPQIAAGNYLLEILNSGGAATGAMAIGEPLTGVAEAVAGTVHMCAAMIDKSVKCWGKNSQGQLGNGTGVDSAQPVSVLIDESHELTDVIAVTAGEVFSCALRNDHAVFCWGENNAGQLGNGTTTRSLFAKKVIGIPESVIAIAAGNYFHCGLTDAGNVYCWGTNGSGQIGGSGITGITPTKIAGLPLMAAIDLGSDHACGIAKTDGSILCWGGNSFGELGNGSFTGGATPVFVIADTRKVTGATKVTVGNSYSCALIKNGAAICWGKNDHGQLGNSGYANSAEAVAIKGTLRDPLLAGFVSIVAGHSHSGNTGTAAHTCALTNLQKVYCWGKNQYGQIGDSSVAEASIPVELQNISGVTSLALGTTNSCAVLLDHTLRCWGRNDGDQLGYKKSDAGPLPVSVEGLSNAKQISVGGSDSFDLDNGVGQNFSCAVTNNGAVYCWGRNDKGQLGNGSLLDSATPVPVGGLRDVSTMVSGGAHSCAVSGGDVYCWGSNESYQLGFVSTNNSTYANSPVIVRGVPSITAVAAGGSGTCAIDSDGSVWCWGQGVVAPHKINALTDQSKAVAITVGFDYSCAVLKSGAAYCWGSNGFGQLGDGSTNTASTPTRIKLPVGDVVVGLDAGNTHSCAILASGRIFCWGANDQYQLGFVGPESSLPVELDGLGKVSAVDASGLWVFFTPYSSTCALLNSAVSCWGNNSFDQIGIESVANQLTPVAIKGLYGVSQISSGGNHSCALYRDGYVTCWGGFSTSQVGQKPLTPRAVLN